MPYIFAYILLGILVIFFLIVFALFKKNFFAFFLKKMKIKEKIVISFVFLFLVLVVLIGLVIEFFNYQIVEENVSKQLQSLSISKAEHIQTYLAQSIAKLKLITSRTALRKTLAHYNENPNQEDLDNIKNVIKDALSSVKDFERVCILNLDGVVVVSTNENFISRDVHDRNFFIEGQKKEGVYFVKEDNNYKIFVSGPMIFENKLIGVGMTVMSLDDLSKIIHNRTGLGKTGEILVSFLDKDGTRIYPLPRLFEEEAINISVETAETAEPMKQALLGKEIFFSNTLDYRNQAVFAASAYVSSAQLGLVAKIDRAEILEEIRSSVIFFVAVILIFILVYYLFSSKLASFLTSPLNRLKVAIKNIEAGDLSFKVQIDSEDEIADLTKGFNVMVDKIKNSRLDIDEQVKNQTEEINNKNIEMQDQQKSILNILEDVEDEKIKVENLAKDLEKFKLAVENASDQIVITDIEGKVIYANKVVEKITGYSLEETLGKKAGTLWSKPMEKKYYENLWNTIKKDKKTFIGQIENIRKNGEKYDASVGISPVIDSKGKVEYFVGIERDITKEKEIDRAKSEFVSLASHQLRTPLSTINWYAEMLLSGDAGKLKDTQKDYLKEIQNGNKRMVELVNALLNVSRLELGTFMIEPKEVDIKKIADTAIQELKFKIAEKKIVFKKKYDSKIKNLLLDEKLIFIVFQNLLSNAVKYNKDRGKVFLEINKKEKNVEIVVSDTGLGIPKKEQSRMFEKMYRAENVKKTNTEGTGLGLYIVKSIIEKSGGKISFSSEENKGTKFVVIIPLSGMKEKIGTKVLDIN